MLDSPSFAFQLCRSKWYIFDNTLRGSKAHIVSHRTNIHKEKNQDQTQTPISISLYITYIQRGYPKAKGIRKPADQPTDTRCVCVLAPEDK